MSDTPIFALALSRLENLRSVTLSQTYEHSRHNEPDIGEYEPPDVTLSPVGHKFFEALIDALSQRQGHIEDLTLGCLSEEYYPSMDAPGLVGVIQRLNPASYRRYQQAFRNLKRLAIALPWTMGENKELNYSGLSALIRSATALEGLCLTFDCETLDFLPIDFILSIHAPNLSTLILENVTFQEPRHLLVLLRVHAATLRYLHLSCLVLELGSWQRVLFEMRSFLSLESCTIGGFCVGTEGTSEDICPTEQSCQFYQAVEAFVCRKIDEDPFQLLQASTPP
ncbi:hypothetical protein F5Y08DRAFT_130934 [Xylaria arbuscula]|nr:hypothetical protein F5Y08DRAFT_130934 [Xylaria arbuscula]